MRKSSGKTAPRRRAPAAARRRPTAGERSSTRVAAPVALVGGLAVALAAGFHVWTGLRVSKLGYQRSQAIELGQRLEVQRQELADELAGLLRTEVLEEESARRLGLGSPTAGQVVDLRATQFAAVPRGRLP